MDPIFEICSYLHDCVLFIKGLSKVAFKTTQNSILFAGLSIQNVYGDSVLVSWQELPNLDPKEFKLYNVWLQDSTNAVVSPLKRESIEPSYNWTGLEAATSYQIRISVATHNCGESEKSQPQAFKTQALNESDKSKVDKLEDVMVRKINNMSSYVNPTWTGVLTCWSWTEGDSAFLPGFWLLRAWC